jgi:hypothetical protein
MLTATVPIITLLQLLTAWRLTHRDQRLLQASVGAHADLGARHLGTAAHVAPGVRRVWTGVGSVHGVLIRFSPVGFTSIQIVATLGYV